MAQSCQAREVGWYDLSVFGYRMKQVGERFELWTTSDLVEILEAVSLVSAWAEAEEKAESHRRGRGGRS